MEVNFIVTKVSHKLLVFIYIQFFIDNSVFMASLRVTFWAACLVQALTYVSSNTSDLHPHAPSDRNDGPDEQARSTCSDERCELVLAVATSISNLSSFLAANAAVANDDVFFTLRMAQGQLYQLRRDAPHIYAAGEVADLLTAADEDLASAALVLQENFKSSADLGEEFNFIMDPARGRNVERIDPTFTIPGFGPQWLAAFQENLAEAGDIPEYPTDSDLCMGQLRPHNETCQEATQVDEGSCCAVDDPCWLMMTNPNTTAYYRTHQAMFLALGSTTGCGPNFEAHARRYFENRLPWNAGPITHEILRYHCLFALLEAIFLAALGIPDSEKDLFLEQGFLCGASVYMPEFFNPSWIRVILSWQKPSGCFGFFDEIEYIPEGEGPVEKRSLLDFSHNSVDDLDDMKVADNFGPSPRRERPIVDDCYSHNSGVALGYLSVALRYLTD